MQQAEGGTGGPNAQLGAYSSGGIYVPSINQIVTLLTTGHGAGGSNEVNVFDLSTGTWNPGGTRPVNPMVRLYMPVGGTWPSSIAYGGIQLTVPVGLVDTGNDYSANISASQRGIQAACVNRQIYGGIADMPGFNKIFLFGGFGYWNANGGSASIGCTYDYVAKKYQLLDAETWPSSAGGANNVTAAAWQPEYSRVLFANESNLYAYTPGAAQGSRVTTIRTFDGCGSDNCSLITFLYDAPRHRLLAFGGNIGGTGLSAVKIYDFSGGPSAPVVTTSAFTGTACSGAPCGLSTFAGPAILYDPVIDKFIHHAGGATLVTIDPVTWATTSTTYPQLPGVTVTTADNGGGASPPHGESEYFRFAYWAAQDAYVAMPTGDTVGVYVYRPLR